MIKPSAAQLVFLHRVKQWGDPRYMPYATEARTAEVCERHGWIVYQSVTEKYPSNGYVLTEAGMQQFAS